MQKSLFNKGFFASNTFMNILNSKAGQFTVLILLGLIWGSSFILMKKGLVAFNSWQVASMRLFFAGLIAIPFLLKSYKKIERKDWLFIALAGFLGNGFPAFMFTYAQQSGLESSLVGSLNALTPAFTLLVGLLFFETKTGLKQVLGLCVGLVGALFIVFNKTGTSFENFSVFPFFIIFLATLFYGFNINIIKSKIGHISPILAGMLPLSIIAFPATGVVLATDTVNVFNQDSLIWSNSLTAVLVLGIVGTALSLFIFNALVQKTSAIFGSAVNYLLPGVAAIWGVLDGEPFGKFEMFSMLFILMGIYLIRSK
jgi:drug/metabolite transporter (DMT)-like permease